MTKKTTAAEKTDPKEDLLMVTARVVERLTRNGDKELHAAIKAAIAATDANASETE